MMYWRGICILYHLYTKCQSLKSLILFIAIPVFFLLFSISPSTLPSTFPPSYPFKCLHLHLCCVFINHFGVLFCSAKEEKKSAEFALKSVLIYNAKCIITVSGDETKWNRMNLELEACPSSWKSYFFPSLYEWIHTSPCTSQNKQKKNLSQATSWYFSGYNMIRRRTCTSKWLQTFPRASCTLIAKKEHCNKRKIWDPSFF